MPRSPFSQSGPDPFESHISPEQQTQTVRLEDGKDPHGSNSTPPCGGAPSQETPQWSPPGRFEEYEIISPLSHGAMGDVYLGRDTLLDREVAIKFIREVQPNTEMRERFLIEARAAARLQHPNVVSIYRVGLLEDRPYIVSEYVKGQGLDSLELPMPWQSALEFGIGLCRGLGAAHRCGVLHRDLKPSNTIISSSGEVKLLDFGLAKFIDMGAERGESPPPLANASAPAPRSTDDVGPDGSPYVNTHGESSVQGTPYYMAPEVWLGEPSTRQSDVYSMGVLLFELCVGVPPHYSPNGTLVELRFAACTQNAGLLIDHVPNADPRFSAVVARCLRRQSSERYASGEELREALEQLSPQSRKIATPEGNPYRGLFAFEAEHRALFFGRNNESGTVLERLRTEPFVLVAADSGIGKSSLCRAGLIPLICEGELGGGRQWQVLSLVPGRAPLASLAAAIAPLLGMTEADLTTQLAVQPACLANYLRRYVGQDLGVVLFIDQLEELITNAAPAEAALVGQALGRLTNPIPGVRMLMTARSDFLARLAALPNLGDVFPQALYFLHPMTPEKIRQAIVGPAEVKGVHFESEWLIDVLITESAQTEGGLPLLQFALTELWDARTDDAITERSLASIGGVAGALARHADQVILSLSVDRRAAARRILLQLVSVEGTRVRRTSDELGEGQACRQALDALVRGRMISAHGTSDGVVYEVAHEALLKGWRTLREWLEESAESRAVRGRLETAAAEWIRLGRAREALWSDRQLAELVLLEDAELTTKERTFIAASRGARRRGRAIRYAVLVSLPLLLAIFYGGIQYRHLKERDRKVATHILRSQEALTAMRSKNAEIDVLRRQAFAAFDARQKEAGEKHWARALALAADSEDAFGSASQALEAALTVEPGRDDVRLLLATTLFEGALAAERDRHFARRKDLVQRMALYDMRGELQQRWQAPAQLSIETHPYGVTVTVQQYVEANGQRRLGEPKALGRTPIANLSLSPGSYLLSFLHAEQIPVRYPVLLHRGESLRLSASLPAARDVPPGFVYVPRGRFLFGTGSEESVRQGFLSTVPLHEVSSEAYLIGRYEVTWADWLEFLGALPPAERAERLIKVPKGSIGGGVELKELAEGGWQLTMQPVTQAQILKVGAPMIYPSRKLRREQSWMRLPVSGIGPADIRAYADWLNRTGRVPGARMCTEFEWERAARGADDREYPHGDGLQQDDANFDETYGKDLSSAGPDEVGSHPTSQGPFGLMDMAGNVFEWTESSLVPNEVVARGGGYFMAAIAARSTNRTPIDPGFRDPEVGVRICATFSGR